MRVRVGARTDVGIVRELNEDAYLTAGPLFAVADGMGGHQGGEVASRVALETLDALKEEERMDLAEAVRRANLAIIERAAGDEALAGMGTTLTLLRTAGDRIQVAHVGDSRAYLFRDGRLHRLTEDHTLVNRMVREGKLTEEEAEHHPQRSILTRALGVEPDIQVDLGAHDVSPGDRILLCSDGLTSMVSEASILDVLGGEPDPQAACDALVEAANAAGGLDNVTVLILDLEEEGARRTEADTGGRTRASAAPAPPAQAPPAPEPEPEPREPPERARAPRRRRLVVRLMVSAAIVAAALLGTRLYLDAQWFVGVSDGRVALFRGIPTEVLGYDLFSLVEETDLPADEAAAAAEAWRDLPDGITASSEADGREIIRQIERDLQAGVPAEVP